MLRYFIVFAVHASVISTTQTSQKRALIYEAFQNHEDVESLNTFFASSVLASSRLQGKNQG